MLSRVVCGLGDTIATFCLIKAFSSEDFPAFARPTIAIKPVFLISLVELQIYLKFLFVVASFVFRPAYQCGQILANATIRAVPKNTLLA